MSPRTERHAPLNRRQRRHLQRHPNNYLFKNTGWFHLLNLLRFLKFKRLAKWVFKKRRPMHRVYNAHTGQFSHCLTWGYKGDEKFMREQLAKRRRA